MGGITYADRWFAILSGGDRWIMIMKKIFLIKNLMLPDSLFIKLTFTAKERG